MLIQPSDLFLKLQTEENIGPSGKNPDNASFDGTATNKFRCLPPLNLSKPWAVSCFSGGNMLAGWCSKFETHGECPPWGLLGLLWGYVPVVYQAAMKSEPCRKHGSCVNWTFVSEPMLCASSVLPHLVCTRSQLGTEAKRDEIICPKLHGL